MSLTAAIITIAALDVAVLAALAFVMRAPFRSAVDAVQAAVVPAQAVQPTRTAPRHRYVPGDRRPRTAQSALR